MSLTFMVDYDFGTGLVRIAARGKLDVLGAARLRSAALKAFAEHPPAVLINLVEVEAHDHQLSEPLLPTPARRADAALVLVCADRSTETGRAIRARLGGRVALFDDERSALSALDALGDLGTAHPRRHLHLPAGAGSPARARELVGRACEEWGLAHLREQAQLIACELVTNAVRHARTDIAFTIVLGPACVHLLVRDRHRGLPVLSPRNAYRPEHSRGLKLVDSLASGWGTVLRPYGKAVWATLQISPAGRAEGRPPGGWAAPSRWPKIADRA